jgi:hypothetical protein
MHHNIRQFKNMSVLNTRHNFHEFFQTIMKLKSQITLKQSKITIKTLVLISNEKEHS